MLDYSHYTHTPNRVISDGISSSGDSSILGGGGGSGGVGGGGRSRFDLSYDPVEASLLTVTAATALWTSIVVPSLWQGRLSEEKLVVLMQFVFTQVNDASPLSPLSCHFYKTRYQPPHSTYRINSPC